MRPRNFAFWLGSVAIAGLFGTASTAQPAPKSEAAPCFNLSCPIEPAAEAPTGTETGAPAKPYDLMASRTCRVYGAAPSSRRSSGRATNPTRRNMIHPSGPSSRMLRSKDSSTFAPNPPILRRVKKLRMLITHSGETVFGTKCR
jgi:hypothetical protein